MTTSLETEYVPRSGWAVSEIAGQAELFPETPSSEFANEIAGFSKFRTAAEENGFDWANSGLIDFDNSLEMGEVIRIQNANVSFIEKFSDSPGSDEDLIRFLRSILHALANTHDELTRQSEDRGHGNVRPELIFASNKKSGYDYVLGPLLYRVPPPFQTELNPSKAFLDQIPTRHGDLYALGMIALRLRLGNLNYYEAFKEIYTVTESNDRDSTWLSWHDGVDLHPNLEELVGADLKLSSFVDRLLERKRERWFRSAREAFEDFEELAFSLNAPKIEKIVIEPSSDGEGDQSTETPSSFWEEPPEKKSILSQGWVNYLLMGLCGILVLGFVVFIFAGDAVKAIFKPSDPILPIALSDKVTISYGDSTFSDCNLIAGGGDCIADDIASEEAKHIPLKANLFVSKVSLISGTNIVERVAAPFVFSSEDGLDEGLKIQVKADGHVFVDPTGLEFVSGIKDEIYKFNYQVTLPDGGGQASAEFTVELNVPNNTPDGISDTVKIALNDADAFEYNILSNDTDADFDQKPAAWNFEEQLRVVQVNGNPIESEVSIPFNDGGASLVVAADGQLKLENLPDVLEDNETLEISYVVSDYLGALADSTLVSVTIAKPNWENSNPIARDDKFEIDLSLDEHPKLFELFSDNGNGEDTDPDLSDEIVEKGIEDAIRIESVNGIEIGPVPHKIELPGGGVISINNSGIVSLDEVPEDVGFDSPLTEKFSYILADNFGGKTEGKVEMAFKVSDDPNYAYLNENWRLKISGTPPNSVYNGLQLGELPDENECLNFAREMTEKRFKKLSDPELGVLGQYWIKSRRGPSVCIIQKSRNGKFVAKLKNDTTIKRNFDAYLLERIE